MRPGSYAATYFRQRDVVLPHPAPSPKIKVVGRLQDGVPEVALRVTYLYNGRWRRAHYHFYVPLTTAHETTARLVEILATHGTRSVTFRGVAFEDYELYLDTALVATAIQCLTEATGISRDKGENHA